LVLVDQQLRRQLSLALQLEEQHVNKQQVLLLRGFEIVEKMMQEKEVKEENFKEGIISFTVHNAAPECLGDRHQVVELNERLSLSDLRSFIGDNLNPPLKDIDIMYKGKILKG
jgi:hypothetical protein